MKKKLICLVLGIMMMLTVFTGCEEAGNNTDETISGSNRAMTLTIATTKGENTSDAAIERVVKAINVITEAKYNTHVEFYFYTKDELKSAILDKVADIEERLRNGEDLASDNFDNEAEDTVIVDDETGRKTTIYPEVDSTQFDIILINGIDDYAEYMKKAIYIDGEEEVGLLAELTPSTLVRQYVDSVSLKAPQNYYLNQLINTDASTAYAIPNNRDFGTYTYLVVNKELADKYYYDPDKLGSYDNGVAGSVTSLMAIEKLFTEVHDDYGTQYTLLANKPNKDAMFYTVDSGVPLGTCLFLGPGVTTSTLLEAPPKNLYATDTYAAYYRVMNTLNKWGCMPTNEVADLNSDFAVAYVTGNETSVAGIDRNKYYVNVCDTPVKSNEAIFGSMYGVTKYTKSVERATEIIEMFNTNADFRNTLYYGVENIDYIKDADSGNVIRISKDWDMDIYDTGNLYLLERSEDLGEYYYAMSANNWKAGKDLNRDAIVGLLLGFKINHSDELDKNIESLRKKAAAWDAQLISTDGDVNAAVSAIKEQMDATSEYKYLCSQEEDSTGLSNQYRTWYSIVVPPKG